MKVVFFDAAQGNNMTTANHTFTGVWSLLTANEVGWDCGLFYSDATNTFKLLKLDLTNKVFTDLGDAWASVAVLGQGEPKIMLGSQCNVVSFNEHAAAYDGSAWSVVSVPAGVVPIAAD